MAVLGPISEPALRHLLSPVRIGRIELRNRIAMAPMGVEIVDADGHVREPVIRYYEERARGGAGLLILEVCAIAYPRGANSRHQIAISDDCYLPGLQELVRRVHAHGAKIAIQLVHHGKVSRLDIAEGNEILVPSLPRFHGALDLLRDLTREEIRLLLAAVGGAQPKLRAASAEEIDWLIERFAEATERARRAGFDAVEIHGAHGYILSQFLSPAWNQRDDAYGGSLENRARLLCEVLRAARRRAGDDFTIWCRLDGVELRTPDGIRPEDAQRSAELAQAAGADAIHVSAYADATSGAAFTEAPLVHREAGYAELAAGIKRRVRVPVIAVGRIEPEFGDRLIAEGKADVIAMARKLLADPALARKLAEGRAADVRPCIYCYTCVAQPFFDRPVRCTVNPVTAREQQLGEIERTRATVARRVLIVGGGPAGLEAARVAALRGHRVTLCEKSSKLGGALRLAALMYEPNERLLHWLERQVRRLDVELLLEREFAAHELRDLSPDVVVVAVGARRERPSWPGAELGHVFDGDELRALLDGRGPAHTLRKLSVSARLALQAARLLHVADDPARLRRASRRYLPIGKRVTILGGGLVGIELAEFLSERRRQVTVLEPGSGFASEMAHPRRWRVLAQLREAGVRLQPDAQVREITTDSVHFAAPDPAGSLRVEQLAADTVIIASGLQANPSLGVELRDAGARVVEIGDCRGVGYLEQAIHDGFRAAAEL